MSRLVSQGLVDTSRENKIHTVPEIVSVVDELAPLKEGYLKTRYQVLEIRKLHLLLQVLEE